MFGADTSFQRFTILLSRVTMPYGGDLVAGLTNLLYEVEMPQLTIQPATRPLRKLRLQSVPHAEILNSYHLLFSRDKVMTVMKRGSAVGSGTAVASRIKDGPVCPGAVRASWANIGPSTGQFFVESKRARTYIESKPETLELISQGPDLYPALPG